MPPERRENIVALSRVVALAAVLVAWSGVMWLFYLATDGALDWFAVNMSLAAENTEKLVDSTGVGKEAETVIDSLKTGGLLQQFVAVAELVVKPLFTAIWLAGMLIILIAPVLLRRLLNLMRKR